MQMEELFNDQNIFPDLPLKESPESVIKDFKKQTDLGKLNTRSKLELFVMKHFDQVDSEIIDYEPEDWRKTPKFLKGIKDKKLRSFAKEIHNLWKKLTKQTIHKNPSNWYSSIHQNYPFIIPGERFSVNYYWDSYFILKGTLTCGMQKTSKGVILNLLDMVNNFGFVPNGMRNYYKSRSQPPLLIQMIEDYIRETKDTSFLNDNNLKIMEKEYQWWMKNRIVKFGTHEILNIYNSNWYQPRPESYKHDFELTKDPKIWHEIAAAAESGWDFSSRWFKSRESMKTIQTTSIIPVDLNSILYGNERILAKFFKKVGNNEKSKFYYEQAKLRKQSMKKYLWNSRKRSFFDYNYQTKEQNEEFYLSNYLPLFYEFKNPVKIDPIIFSFKGGIPVSLFYSKKAPQQWDFPNSFPSTTFFFLEGLWKKGNYDDIVLAEAQKFVNQAFCNYKERGVIFEKYNVEEPHKISTGGEYETQKGFGWTNGVLIFYLQKFGHILKHPKCNY